MKPGDWGKLIVTDVVCIALVAGLTAAGGAALIAAALVGVGTVAGNAVAIRKAREPRLLEGTSTHGEAGGTDTAATVSRLDAYKATPYIGPYATRLRDQVTEAAKRQDDYTATLMDRFGNGATTQRFSMTVAQAVSTIEGNARNALTLIDATDKDALSRAMRGAPRVKNGTAYTTYSTRAARSGRYSNYISNGPTTWAGATGGSAQKTEEKPQPAKEEATTETTAAQGESTQGESKTDFYQDILDRLGKTADANDRLLFAIEKAQVELSSLDADEGATDEALSELDRLSHDLTYYK